MTSSREHSSRRINSFSWKSLTSDIVQTVDSSTTKYVLVDASPILLSLSLSLSIDGLFQPIWNICLSNWTISQTHKYLKTVTVVYIHPDMNSNSEWILREATIRTTLPEINIAPKNGGFNRNLLFQGSIFRGYVSLREGIPILGHVQSPKKKQRGWFDRL